MLLENEFGKDDLATSTPSKQITNLEKTNKINSTFQLISTEECKLSTLLHNLRGFACYKM